MNSQVNRSIPARLAALAVVAMAFAAGGVATAESNEEYSGKLKDAWLDGRIETAYALNRHLNPLSIDTSVEGGVVTLEGNVESDIDRDLAGEIAQNVDGVSDVRNNLAVDSAGTVDRVTGGAKKAARSFLQTVDDATTTAAIKSKLVANGNTKGLDINIDTNADVVTLTGSVRSGEEKDLAAAIANNTRNVSDVNNKLTVDTR